MTTPHQEHATHPHAHGPDRGRDAVPHGEGRGHPGVRHGDHVDHPRDGHRHAGHEGHRDGH
jgi:hypothetical protein